jgi:integrase
MKKTPTVHVRADKNWLRLEWTFGKRYYLYLNLEDNKANRLKSKNIQLKIEADIETGVFDESLKSYRLKLASRDLVDLTTIHLFKEWIKYKTSEWDSETAKQRNYFLTQISNYFEVQIAAKDITLKQACQFWLWLQNTGNNHDTLNRKLGILRECWEWGGGNYDLPDNPWNNIKPLKPMRRKTVQPFSVKEINLILNAFAIHPTYNDLALFVEFLMKTGARLGEAAGLQWDALSGDCSTIKIRTQYTSGHLKPPKTGSDRSYSLPQSLSVKLLTQRDKSLSTFVFTHNQKPINIRNFRQRAWKPILAALDIPYRKPYNSRATFISHALEQGHNPVAIAEITGHDPKVLFDHYAGLINPPAAPELF